MKKSGTAESWQKEADAEIRLYARSLQKAALSSLELWTRSGAQELYLRAEPIGQATIHVLSINDPDFLAVRDALIREQAFPLELARPVRFNLFLASLSLT